VNITANLELEDLRTCTLCALEKDIEQFRWNDSTGQTGFASRCQSCKQNLAKEKKIHYNLSKDRYKQKKRLKDNKRARSKSNRAGQYAIIIARDPCCYCGQISNTLDHISPMVSGGKTHADNLAACCYQCNEAKAKNSLLGFLSDGHLPSVALSKPSRHLGKFEVEAAKYTVNMLMNMLDSELDVTGITLFQREQFMRGKI
jgi:hypothetical protein